MKFLARQQAEMKALDEEAASGGPAQMNFNQAEIAPRSTGSLQWRQERGECGQGGYSQKIV